MAFCSGGDQRVRGDTGYVTTTPRHARRRALPRHRPARADPPPAQAGRGDGRRLRDRRRPRAAPRLRPHDRRRQRALRPDRAEGRLVRRRLRRGAARRAWSARRRPRRSGSCAASTTRSRRSTMGLVNTVVPLERLEEETVAVVPRDARALPVRAAAAEGELQRRTRTAAPASSSSPTTRTCSSTRSEEAQEGREAYKAEAQARLLEVPAPAVSAA